MATKTQQGSSMDAAVDRPSAEDSGLRPGASARAQGSAKVGFKANVPAGRWRQLAGSNSCQAGST